MRVLYKLKIFTKIHGNDVCDSVAELLFVDVVVVLQHLGASGQREKGDGVAQMEIWTDVLKVLRLLLI